MDAEESPEETDRTKAQQASQALEDMTAPQHLVEAAQKHLVDCQWIMGLGSSRLWKGKSFKVSGNSVRQSFRSVNK